MANATIVVGHNGVSLTTPVSLELPPEFTGPQYHRLRTLEQVRLLAEAFGEALKFNADNPISNDTIIVISFGGMPETERKEA